MAWSFPQRVSPENKPAADAAPSDAVEPAATQTATQLRGRPPKPSVNPAEEDDEEGKGKSGGGGAPKLKPALAEDGSGLASLDDSSGSGSSGKSGGGAGEPPLPDLSSIFGPWEFHAGSIMLYNRAHKRRMKLEELNSPSKVMKVIIALGSQKGWDADNLVKALDHAARQRFGKTLYQVFSHVQDTATIDWKKGSLKPEAPRAPGPK